MTGTGQSSSGSLTRARRRTWCRSPHARAPKYDDFARRGGRFGAHKLHENVPLPTVRPLKDVILGTFFNGGYAPTTFPTNTSEGGCRLRAASA